MVVSQVRYLAACHAGSCLFMVVCVLSPLAVVLFVVVLFVVVLFVVVLAVVVPFVVVPFVLVLAVVVRFVVAVIVPVMVVSQVHVGAPWELSFRCVMPPGYSMFSCEGSLEVYVQNVLQDKTCGTITLNPHAGHFNQRFCQLICTCAPLGCIVRADKQPKSN